MLICGEEYNSTSQIVELLMYSRWPWLYTILHIYTSFNTIFDNSFTWTRPPVVLTFRRSLIQYQKHHYIFQTWSIWSGCHGNTIILFFLYIFLNWKKWSLLIHTIINFPNCTLVMLYAWYKLQQFFILNVKFISLYKNIYLSDSSSHNQIVWEKLRNKLIYLYYLSLCVILDMIWAHFRFDISRHNWRYRVSQSVYGR
jgi:hypothetical protein